MQEEDRKIKIVLNKLKILHYPHAGTNSDTWITEVLFKPGFERLNLIEWILVKLEISIDMFEHPSSLEGRIQNLHHILSVLGLCSKNDSDIIEGKAPKEKQLAFWEMLINVSSEKAQLPSQNIESSDSSDSDKSIYGKNKLQLHESSCKYLNQVLEDVNLNCIFEQKVNLFPDYLLKEMKVFFKKNGGFDVSAADLRKSAFPEGNIPELSITTISEIGEKNFYTEEFEDYVIPDKSILTEIENNIQTSMCNLQTDLNDSFNEAYNGLKLYMPNVLTEEFTDIGPAFEKADAKLKSVAQLKNASTLLISSDIELDAMSSSLSTIEIPQGHLTDIVIGETIRIISEMKEKDSNFSFIH